MVDGGEAGIGQHELKIQQWLTNVAEIRRTQGSDGQPTQTREENMVILVDPENPSLSSRDSAGASTLKIPTNTPDGSYVAAVSPGKTVLVDGKVIEKKVQVFRIQREGNGYTAERVQTGNMEGVTELANEEIPAGVLRPEISDKPAARKLHPETATAELLAKPGASNESRFQMLPSESPHINIGLLTPADVRAAKLDAQQRAYTAVNRPAAAISMPAAVKVPA